MRISLDDKVYSFTNGRYVATFLGVKVHDADGRADDNGRPYGDGFRWGFQLKDGPDIEKVVTVVTSQSPTKKNACGRMIKGIQAGVLDSGTEFDSEQYVGGFYYVSILNGVLSHVVAPAYIGTEMPDSSPAVGNVGVPSHIQADNARRDPIPF